MQQYYQIKKQYPDTVLLYRMGDFFETFEEDAKIASKVLGITLTKRANGAAGEVPLAGFPHHALDSYLPKLVRAGYRVAVCEQIEDPKFAKGIVNRDVIEVVTPGVAFSDNLLENKRNNYLVSVYFEKNFFGVSFCDISTGEFYLYEINENQFLQQLVLLSPTEVLIPKNQKEIIEPYISKLNSNVRITRIDEWIFNLQFAQDLLTNHFDVVNLKGFGIVQFELGLIAAGAIFNYLKETQKSNLNHITKILPYNPSEYLILDFVTKRNLEIIYSMQEGNREGTLISILDKTETAMGGRLLKKWISAPLKNCQKIIERQNSIDEIFGKNKLRDNLKNELSEIGDLERLISKVCTGRINPREMVGLKNSLKKIPLLKQLLEQCQTKLIKNIFEELDPLENIIEKIENSIVAEPPLNVGEGKVIKKGYNSELDELLDLTTNAKDWIANLQTTERQRTNIPSLKVGFTKVFGYYIEISNAHKDKVPTDYIRKQTLVNCERYITPELKKYEDKILNAEENIFNLENEIFNEIKSFVAKEVEKIQINSKAIANLDCIVSFAAAAYEFNYVRPVISESDEIKIIEGRHPVVERILPAGEKFTPNDCYLNNSTNQIIILTGPNMSGKSVYLRQIGLIVLMAQIGSFVPASSAEIGIVDNIFTRVGASDNITSGESTFLVEMQEAANILNNATNKSLILLDEIGRGTSTFDGLSIAWAITEYIHENPNISAKTIFATHYHELNELADIYPRIKNYKVDVREYGDKVVFLHKVLPGSADHSYGIQVGMMAGLPRYVTERAKEILSNLESKELTPYEMKKEKIARIKKENELQFNLFEIVDDRIRKEISEISVDELTPIEALNKLNELKKKLNNG